MSTQTENMSESDKMEIKQKISELSDNKIKYINLMFQLVKVKNRLLTEHISELMKLLINAINIKKNQILEELDKCFTSLMISYIFDIYDVINDRLDIEKYNDRHQNLIRINKQIEYQVKNYDFYNLNDLHP
jgi:hypothetical protein